MIFRFAAEVDDGAIGVLISWDDDGQRVGQVLVPADIDAVLGLGLAPDFVTSAEGAISYGMFVAMKAGMRMHVTGDPSVWNPVWGELEGVPVSVH